MELGDKEVTILWRGSVNYNIMSWTSVCVTSFGDLGFTHDYDRVIFRATLAAPKLN
jgi:hypothetical protein